VIFYRNDAHIRSDPKHIASYFELGGFGVASRTDTEFNPPVLVGDQAQLKIALSLLFGSHEERMKVE
jgi:hypothetical protein